MIQFFISDDRLQRVKNWLYSQSQVTAFRINDEFLYRFPPDTIVIDNEKGRIIFVAMDLSFKIWKRDYPRNQYLIY